LGNKCGPESGGTVVKLPEGRPVVEEEAKGVMGAGAEKSDFRTDLGNRGAEQGLGLIHPATNPKVAGE